MRKELTDRTAAAIVLRSLMRSVIDGADARIVDEVTGRLKPSDMFQVEYMMILEAVQSLRHQNCVLSLKTIQDELKPEDPAGFALIVLDSIVENRRQGSDDPRTVSDLVDFLITFRSHEPPK